MMRKPGLRLSGQAAALGIFLLLALSPGPASAEEALPLVTYDSFEEVVLAAPKPTLVEFWAVWSGPSKRIAPYLEELSSELGDCLAVVRADIDESPRLAADYGVRSIPALLIFQEGQEAARHVGAVSKEKLRDWIVGVACAG